LPRFPYTPLFRSRLGTSYGDRAHFKEAIASGEPYISRPVLGRTTGTLLVSFLHPIRNDHGQLLGLAGGSINLATTSLLPDPGHLLQKAVFNLLNTQNFTRIDDIESTDLVPMLPDPDDTPQIDHELPAIPDGDAD